MLAAFLLVASCVLAGTSKPVLLDPGLFQAEQLHFMFPKAIKTTDAPTVALAAKAAPLVLQSGPAEASVAMGHLFLIPVRPEPGTIAAAAPLSAGGALKLLRLTRRLDGADAREALLSTYDAGAAGNSLVEANKSPAMSFQASASQDAPRAGPFTVRDYIYMGILAKAARARRPAALRKVDFYRRTLQEPAAEDFAEALIAQLKGPSSTSGKLSKKDAASLASAKPDAVVEFMVRTEFRRVGLLRRYFAGHPAIEELGYQEPRKNPIPVDLVRVTVRAPAAELRRLLALDFVISGRSSKAATASGAPGASR